jgi:hypothetical protein
MSEKTRVTAMDGYKATPAIVTSVSKPAQPAKASSPPPAKPNK